MKKDNGLNHVLISAGYKGYRLSLWINGNISWKNFTVFFSVNDMKYLNAGLNSVEELIVTCNHHHLQSTVYVLVCIYVYQNIYLTGPCSSTWTPWSSTRTPTGNDAQLPTGTTTDNNVYIVYNNNSLPFLLVHCVGRWQPRRQCLTTYVTRLTTWTLREWQFHPRCPHPSQQNSPLIIHHNPKPADAIIDNTPYTANTAEAFYNSGIPWTLTLGVLIPQRGTNAVLCWIQRVNNDNTLDSGHCDGEAIPYYPSIETELLANGI